MSRVEIDALLGACLEPSAKNSAARKDERVRTGDIDHG
jgi:hypothetical protein